MIAVGGKVVIPALAGVINVPDGIPTGIMPSRPHDPDDLCLLFLVDRGLDLNDGLKQVVTDLFPFRHFCDRQ
jgi:hypothetical protein